MLACLRTRVNEKFGAKKYAFANRCYDAWSVREALLYIDNGDIIYIMPRKHGEKTPQPAPEDDLQPSIQDKASQAGEPKPPICPIWGLACQAVIDPQTQQLKVERCTYRAQVERQPSPYGNGTANVQRMVTETLKKAGNVEGGYDGPCLDLDGLERVCQQILAKTEPDTQE